MGARYSCRPDVPQCVDQKCGNGDDTSSSSSDDDDKSCSKTPITRDGTIVLIDWDDTIFPKSYAALKQWDPFGAFLPSSEDTALLIALAERAIPLVNLAKSLGKVVMVTNARAAWVQWSCQRYMSALYPTLQCGIKIISARSVCEHDRSVAVSDWKSYVFRQEVAEYFADSPAESRKNIISIGDAQYECDALLSCTSLLPNVCGKIIKLIEQPQIEELAKEHALVKEFLADVTRYDGDIHLEFNGDRFAPMDSSPNQVGFISGCSTPKPLAPGLRLGRQIGNISPDE